MIAICPNPYRDIELKTTKKIKQIIEAHNEQAVICPVFKYSDEEPAPMDMELHSLHDVADKCSFAVVVGGDGTILASARELFTHDVPIAAVNLGTKGFMAALEENNIDRLHQLFSNDYYISCRMMLDVTLYRNGEKILSDCALNDVVIRGYVDCIDIALTADRNLVTSFSGDGVILSTPTGSTGYSMSAGGPIVEPEANALILTPISAHTMSARTYVLSQRRVVRATPTRLHDRRAYLSVDGQIVDDLHNGDVIEIKKSENYTKMLDFGVYNFYETTFHKLR